MKKRLVLLMALSLTFAFPAAVMAEDTTAAEETADDTEAADSTAEDADVKSEGVMLNTRACHPPLMRHRHYPECAAAAVHRQAHAPHSSHPLPWNAF